ncbi:MAG: hypothetical protein HY700_02730 [Gemmatimonadetes bacterium]|nr:hypothetical protein [Gemmatimonadota bacterium]
MNLGRWLPLALLGLLPGTLRAQRVAYEGGLSLATGNYFYTTRTTSWTISSGIAYTPGRLIFRAALPLYVQNSSLIRGAGGGMMLGGAGGGSAGGGGMMGGGATGGMMGGGGTGSMMGGGGAMPNFRAALGDPTVQAGWRIVNRGQTALAVSAGAKVPTTDTADYGTGKWDVGGTLSLARQAGAAMVFGLDLSYWHLGDLPALAFRDPVAATVSAGKIFANTWGASLLVTAGTSALPGYDAPISIGAAVTRLGKDRLWGLSTMIGFTETVPDFSIGASWRIGL